METRIERQCVASGVRMTGPRRIIARILSEATDHPDVDELHRRAHYLDKGISLATVYRTVRLLEQHGILERRNLGSRRARYEQSGEHDHFHLVDQETGRVIEFDDPETETLMRRIAARHGFDLVSLKIEMFGRRAAPLGGDQQGDFRAPAEITASTHPAVPSCEDLQIEAVISAGTLSA